jgi:hypothetical protein
VADYPVELVRHNSWKGATLKYSGFLYDMEHIIIDTDYENYAVAYGCDNYFLGLIHVRWATFMTKIDYAEAEYIELAKKKMRDLEYDYNFWWRQTGIICGWEAGPTADVTMINVFYTEPNWEEYGPSTSSTMRVQEIWGLESNIPRGSIIGPLLYNGKEIETPIRAHILDSDYQGFFYLSKIAFSSRDYGTIYVDVWLLAENLA